MGAMLDGNTAALRDYMASEDRRAKLHADYAVDIDDAIRERAEDEMASGAIEFEEWLANDVEGQERAVSLALAAMRWHDLPTAAERKDARERAVTEAEDALEDAYIAYRQRDEELRADVLHSLTEEA